MLKFLKKPTIENDQLRIDLEVFRSRLKALEIVMDNQDKRIKTLEDTVFALKENVKEEKQQAKLQQKKKWLTSYPDETK